MSFFTDKTVVIITGPTAVGKSAVAVALAKHFQTEFVIVNLKKWKTSFFNLLAIQLEIQSLMIFQLHISATY